MTRPDRKEIALVLLLVLGVIFWRIQRLDQPILENYVGRQIPTAMVAKNLVRGSGFFSPELDTGPFPNRFLVEPPIDAQVVAWISRVCRVPLDRSGRAISALATGLGALGLYLLVRRRSGVRPAVVAVVAFACFPVTIRYGRAFQPDAFTLGLTLLGLALWEKNIATLQWLGWLSLSAGIAQKVHWSLIFVPLMFVVPSGKTNRGKLAAVCVILPALLWYLWVFMAARGEGSGASADNAERWAAVLGFKAFFEPARYLGLCKDLTYRALTPIGGLLLLIGLMQWRKVDILWKVWLVAALGTLGLLFGKLHHDYYWLMLAPPAAGWSAVAFERLREWSKPAAITILLLLFGLGIWQTRATWTTPPAWENAVLLGDSIAREIPSDYLVIGPEAIIYLGDRRGCRLEYEPAAVTRAANEWRPEPKFQATDPFALVHFYRKRNRFTVFADLPPEPDDLMKRRLHEQIKAIPGAWLYNDHGGRFVLVGLPELKP